MGIQPIDLQTLYAQMEKVGKAQVQHQAANQNARDAELVNNREEAEKRLQTVQETEAGEESIGKVDENHEKSGGSPQNSSGHQDEKHETDAPPLPSQEIIRDPDLGSKIDISG